MARKKKFINNSQIPTPVIEKIARCLWPAIREFYDSEEGQRAFAQWQAQQAEEKEDMDGDT